jgi:hypothetical protein
VKHRQDTIDSHTKSLHYFHSFSIVDRCDSRGLSDNTSFPNIDEVDVKVVVPTECDHDILKKNTTAL